MVPAQITFYFTFSNSEDSLRDLVSQTILWPVLLANRSQRVNLSNFSSGNAPRPLFGLGWGGVLHPRVSHPLWEIFWRGDRPMVVMGTQRTHHSPERFAGLHFGLEEFVDGERLLLQLPYLDESSRVSISRHYQRVRVLSHHELQLRHCVVWANMRNQSTYFHLMIWFQLNYGMLRTWCP